LAFPKEPKTARRFSVAYWRESIRLSATADEDFAGTPQMLPPRLLQMRDSEADKLIRLAETELFQRKKAYFATQALFAEAFIGKKIEYLRGFDTSQQNNADGRYVMTNIWLKKHAGASTKPLIRDAISPSKPVIHAIYAMFATVNTLISANCAKDEAAAMGIIFSSCELIGILLDTTMKCRALAVASDRLNLSDADLLEFVAA
jgi:hypothetical protein